MIKLKSPYDNQKVKDLISRQMGKPFEDIKQEEFETTALMWYAMLIEFIDMDSSTDLNFQTMKLQTTIKSFFWDK